MNITSTINQLLSFGHQKIFDRRVVVLFFIIYFLVKLPWGFEPPARDDFYQRNLVLGSQQLVEKGVPNNELNAPLSIILQRYFTFLSADPEEFKQQSHYGILPWWTDSEAKVNFYRPVAVFTHWIDYQLWPHNMALMRLHSFLWFGFLLFLLSIFYRRFSSSTRVANLALIFFAIDISGFASQYWVAARNVSIVSVFALSTFLLYIKYAESKMVGFLICSYALYIAALLSSEIGVFAFLFIAGFQLFFTDDSWKKMCLHLLPFIVMTLLWRINYSASGFGSANVGFYIDPMGNPLQFMTQFFTGSPIKLASIFHGVDGIEGYVAPRTLPLLVLVSLGFSLFVIKQLLPIIKNNRSSLLCCFVCVGSMVPMSAVEITQDRHMMVLSIVVSLLLAEFIGFYFRRYKNKESHNNITDKAPTGSAFLFYFLLTFYAGSGFLAHFTGGLAYSFSPYFARSGTEAAMKGLSHKELESLADTHTILLNIPTGDISAMYTYAMVYDKYRIPTSMRALTPAFNSLSLTRINETTLLVKTNDNGSLFSPREDDGLIGPYFLYTFDKMLRVRPLQETLFDFEELTLEVTKFQGEEPSEIRVTLKDFHNRKYKWIYFNWSDQSLELINLPAIGETVEIEGMRTLL